MKINYNLISGVEELKVGDLICWNEFPADDGKCCIWLLLSIEKAINDDRLIGIAAKYNGRSYYISDYYIQNGKASSRIYKISYIEQ